MNQDFEQIYARLIDEYDGMIVIRGEDIKFGGNKLNYQPQPSIDLFVDFKDIIHEECWEELDYIVTHRYKRKCEYCGVRTMLKTHDVWSYNHNTKTQKLERLIALCNDCYSVAHIEQTMDTPGDLTNYLRAMKHFRYIRKMNKSQSFEYIENAGEELEKRMMITWKLDLSMIEDSGIALSESYLENMRNQKVMKFEIDL